MISLIRNVKRNRAAIEVGKNAKSKTIKKQLNPGPRKSHSVLQTSYFWKQRCSKELDPIDGEPRVRQVVSPRRIAGGSGLAKVPYLRVCKHPSPVGWHIQEAEGRIRVLSWHHQVGVVSTSSSTHGGKTGLPARVSGRHVVRGWQSSPILECVQVGGEDW